jgi:hypothetical protein
VSGKLKYIFEIYFYDYTIAGHDYFASHAHGKDPRPADIGFKLALTPLDVGNLRSSTIT